MTDSPGATPSNDDIYSLEEIEEDSASRPLPRTPIGSRGIVQHESAAADANACANCGYSLIGLMGDRCPECGVKFDRSYARLKRKKDYRKALRQEYVRALSTLGISLGVLALILLLFGEITSFPFYLLKYAIHVPVGVGVFFFLCLVWIGFDEPWGITTLRLAAIYAIVDCVMLPFSLVPVGLVGLFGWALGLITYFGLLRSWLNLEDEEAVVTVFATGIVRFVLTLFVWSQFGG